MFILPHYSSKESNFRYRNLTSRMRLSRQPLLLHCLIATLFGRCLLATSQVLVDRGAPSSWQNDSASPNTSTKEESDLQFTFKYLVFPQNPQKVAEIQNILYGNVHSGSVRRIESHLRPQYDGVEFWIVHAIPIEILEVTTLCGNDVSPVERVQY